MTLLDTHLEQISLCAAAITDLPFPPPKQFTNALLHPHDITALIRDTETHERALFSVPPPPPRLLAKDPSVIVGRKSNVNRANGNGLFASGPFDAHAIREPRKNTAVAAVLGKDMMEEIRRGGGGGRGIASRCATSESAQRGEVDLEVLLKGAERLCGVYPIPGATEEIESLRTRHSQLVASIANYEVRVTKQAAQLERMNRPRDYDAEDDAEDVGSNSNTPIAEQMEITEEDLRKEEEDIRELERKRSGLEDRVSGMERDLGGLLR
ncbi:MAG: hypothetical protein M1827_001680 [Pycnora praestabilis]|nr:MAG: hypothetical protein M1827_001680 [Pycnora praestabilis]